MEPRIELLGPDDAVFDTVLGWHWREWSGGHADADLDEWRARLRLRCAADGIPFTLVAYLGSEPVGCLSVCHDDADERFAEHGPWLSGMFVVGSARNLGVGRALLQVAERRAQNVGVTKLWLHTSEAGSFYARCGWEFVHRKDGLHDDAVMSRVI